MRDKNIILERILIPSLHRLYQVDYDNIKFGVSERNICARLAYHIENKMREYDNCHHTGYFEHYYADVEYNRMGNGDLKHYENSEKLPQYMVSDLLIQSRGAQPNLLAVEMKRKGNYRNVNEDKVRLKALVSQNPTNPDFVVYGTLVGAFIVYSEEWVKIDIFEDERGHGECVEHREYSREELCADSFCF